MKTEDIAGTDDQYASRIAYLVAGYLRQSLTTAEHDELDAWLTSSEQNQLLFEELTSPHFLSSGLQQISDEELLHRLAIAKKKAGIRTNTTQGKRYMYALAACVAMLMMFFIYQKFSTTASHTDDKVPLAIKETITPGLNFAVLTLPDGQQLELPDTPTRQQLAGQTNLLPGKEGGIVYTADASTELHTLTTPVGCTYRVRLADGSTIWLNASSSLRYRTGFDGQPREVTLSGEAYFEVAHQSTAGGNAVPFVVRSGTFSVEVLGTRFDVNTYGDDGILKTSLLEGSVRAENIILHPGQQLLTSTSGKAPQLLDHQSLENEVSWKDGLFNFKNATIVEIMQRLQRWYNVQVRYEDKTDAHFNLSVSRSESLQTILDLLAATKNVSFSISGRTVTVRR